MEALFSRLLIVGQNRNTSLVSVFEYEFCAVPFSIIDEFGFIRKGNKANIVKKLATISTAPCPSNKVIVDGGQLVYHIVWPCGGTISTVVTSIATRLKNYRVIPTKIIFYRYGNVSAKDHERSRRAGGAVPAEYNHTLTSPLPNRDIIMKSKANNRLISRLLCTCTMDSHILMVGEDEGLLNDHKANVLMISYMIEAVRNCKRAIRIISDDTNANYNKVTKKKGKPPLVKSLPPTDKNLLLQMLRAHCQAL